MRYSALLYLALLVTLAVADPLTRRAGLDPARVVVAMALLVPGFFAGTRAVGVLLDRRGRERAADPRRGRAGGVLFGGLSLPLVLSGPLLALLGLPFGAFWDVALVSALIGMVPGRLACLAGGCCAGRQFRLPLAPWLADPVGVRARRLPNALCEAGLGASVAALCLFSWQEAPFAGSTALLAVGAYSAGRFFLQWMREERGPILARLDAVQWIALALVGISALGLGLGGRLGATSGGFSEVVAGAQAGSASPLHGVVCGLLLLPVLRLYRFVGCTFYIEASGGPAFELRMGVMVPDTFELGEDVTLTIDLDDGSGPVQRFELTSEAQSPLLGRSVETTESVTEGTYTATCEVVRISTGDIRRAECMGTLDDTNQVLFFELDLATPEGTLVERFCFEPLS